MGATKYSKQRASIIEYLSNTKEHPTADMVYHKVRETFPNISLGTVYRNLNLLVEQGDVRKVECGDGMDHFDWDTSEHYHFICKECGRVLDLDMDSITHINRIANAGFGGSVEGSVTYFFGRCPECMEAAKKVKKGIDRSDKRVYDNNIRNDY